MTDNLPVNNNVKFNAGVITENKFTNSQIHSLSHKKLVPQLEVLLKRHSTKPSAKPNKKEGLNTLYKASAILWLLFCHRFPSLRINTTSHFLKEAMRNYRDELYNLSYDPECLDYPSLIDLGYMKEKHWVYAAYIATITSLPLLHKVCDVQEILRAILAKTSFGTNIKLLDNLNDEIHDVSQALDSLCNWLSAHTKGEYINRNKDQDRIVIKAENSAFKMGTWVFEAISSCQLYASKMYEVYSNDAMKMVEGQINSIKHKADRKGKLPSIREYISNISEKNNGNLWIDIDLCFLENGLQGFKKDQLRAIELLKVGNSLIFKSSLFYDDAEDIYEDLRTESINSAIILALERGIISYNDLKKKSSFEIVKRLRETGILMDVVRLADMFFITGIEMLDGIKDRLEGILDKQGLIQSYRLLRMFLLRKLLIMNRDYETMKLFFSSLGDFERIKRNIPDDIMALQRYLA